MRIKTTSLSGGLFLLCSLLYSGATLPEPEPQQVNYCVDPDWLPYEAIRDGEHIGLSADYIAIVAERTGIEFHLVPTESWVDTLEALKDGRCDLIPMLNPTPAREEYLTFSKLTSHHRLY
ncbi:MAG: transporter substrate-binding domain-containing protein [Idiomarina sp.]|nr:transporter substrate-binding domain-containing protein [Idiomarina sp.]